MKLGIAGLGVALLGDGVEDTLWEIERELEQPDEDSGWIKSFSTYGTCPGERIRAVRWQQLRVMFTDGATDYGRSGERHFFEWDYGVPEEGALKLTTEEGVGLGSTVAEVRKAYPFAEFALEDAMYGPSFSVRGPSEFGLLWGTFDGRQETSTVRFLSYGAPQCGE